MLAAMFLVAACWAAVPALGAQASQKKILAATPPMGWNDWAHYQCGFTADTILGNARALVSTGLSALGYNTVTIDDCWMLKDRDAGGNLEPDPQRFPNGMKAVADAVHKLGLKFGIYEDSGAMTCGGFAGGHRAADKTTSSRTPGCSLPGASIISSSTTATSTSRPASAQHWRYAERGNLVNDGDLECLTAAGPESKPQFLQMQVCGDNLATQIWSLPN